MVAGVNRSPWKSVTAKRFAFTPAALNLLHMDSHRIFLLLAGLILAAPASARTTDCTDPAGPEVNWTRCYLDGRDLSKQNLAGARLIDASFERAKLSGADLRGVNGYRAKFISTEMKGARLDNGTFSEADFTKADLSGASLANTDLRRARLYRTNLRGADLTGARTGAADLMYADLSGATWTDGKKVCAEGSIGQCN